MMKRLIEKRLAQSAQRLIAARQPEIIAITGSVGKTTTKDAIAAVLAARFAVRATHKNYNNEIGLPLTVIGVDSPGRSLLGWSKVFREAKNLAVDRQAPYPEMLVLEMGIDHPGDMDVLTHIAPPARAVITRLGTAHAEFFSSLTELHAEKLKLAAALGDEGIFIYNYEDEKLRAAGQASKARTLSYGFSRQADVAAENIALHVSADPGVNFKLVYDGSAVPVSIPGLISRPGILAALAGAAVGFSYGLNAIEIAQALKNFHTPAGRMHLLPGGYDGLLIDDSYNSSPEAVRESLDTVAEIDRQEYGEAWIVLGDMRELGVESRRAHHDIGEYVAGKGFDHLVTVGPEAALIAEEARKRGMKTEQIVSFTDADSAAAYIKEKVGKGDLVLVKGSQAVRLEKVVKQLMKEPKRAAELLVRQGKEWK